MANYANICVMYPPKSPESLGDLKFASAIDHDQIMRDAQICIDELVTEYDLIDGFAPLYNEDLDAAAFGNPIAQEAVRRNMAQLLEEAEEGKFATLVEVSTDGDLRERIDYTSYDNVDKHIALAVELGGDFLKDAKRLASYFPDIPHHFNKQHAYVGLVRSNDQEAYDAALGLVLDYPDLETRLQLMIDLNQRRPDNVESLEPYIIALSRDLSTSRAVTGLVRNRWQPPSPLVEEALARLTAVDWDALDTGEDYDPESPYYERTMYIHDLARTARASGESDKYTARLGYYFEELPVVEQFQLLRNLGGLIKDASKRYRIIAERISVTGELSNIDKRTMVSILSDEGDNDAALRMIDAIDNPQIALSAYTYLVAAGGAHLGPSIAKELSERGEHGAVSEVANMVLQLGHIHEALAIAQYARPSVRLHILRNVMRLEHDLPYIQ